MVFVTAALANYYILQSFIVQMFLSLENGDEWVKLVSLPKWATEKKIQNHCPPLKIPQISCSHT